MCVLVSAGGRGEVCVCERGAFLLQDEADYDLKWDQMILLQTACVQVLDTLDKQVLFSMITNQFRLVRNYTVIMAVQKFETV